MDQEPLPFLRLFAGQLLLTTGDYKLREPQWFPDESDESYACLFQLIGKASEVQKAKEMPPFRDSLSSSGLYVLLTRGRVWVWAGTEYFMRFVQPHQWLN